MGWRLLSISVPVGIHLSFSSLAGHWKRESLSSPLSKIKSKVSFSHFWLFVTQWTKPTRLLCLWDSPGTNTGVGYYFLLQGIFPTQESNWCLFHCRQIPYCLSHQGSLPQNQEVPQIKLNTEHSRTFQDEICFFFYFLSNTLSIEKSIW